MDLSIGSYAMMGILLLIPVLILGSILFIAMRIRQKKKESLYKLCLSTGLTLEPGALQNKLIVPANSPFAKGQYRKREILISEKIAFRGSLPFTFITAKLKTTPPAGLFIISYGPSIPSLWLMGIGIGYKAMKTGNPSFDKRLRLETDNDEWAKNVLTNDIVQGLTELDFECIYIAKGEITICLRKQDFSEEFARKHFDEVIKLAEKVDSI